MDLSWKTAVEQSTSGARVSWDLGGPSNEKGEVVLIALQKECLEPQAYAIALLV